MKTIKSILIPVPPLPEQHRIVERIENLFAKLDEARDKVQEALDECEKRKVSVLHKAFSGELTERWRIISNESKENWKQYKYGELGTSKLGKMLDKEKNIGKQVRYLRNVNVRWFGFDLEDVATMRATDEEIAKLAVKKGDLFICEGGEPGRCAIWGDEDNDNLIFQKALHRFRPNEKVISEYLCYYLFYLGINNELDKYFTGTTIKHLTGKALAKITIDIPSILEQKEIVNALNTIFEKEKVMGELLDDYVNQIDQIKKSILSKAFRGELGTNDSEEESAVGLVEDILRDGE